MRTESTDQSNHKLQNLLIFLQDVYEQQMGSQAIFVNNSLYTGVLNASSRGMCEGITHTCVLQVVSPK